MADYLVLKRDKNGATGAASWRVVTFAQNKTADVAGATEALKEGYTGPGRYGVVRADNARTVQVADNPAITEDPAPSWT